MQYSHLRKPILICIVMLFGLRSNDDIRIALSLSVNQFYVYFPISILDLHLMKICNLNFYKISSL